MSDFLIEIYSEEMPANCQSAAANNFKKLFVELFDKQKINYQENEIFSFVSTRRLVFLARNLEQKQVTPSLRKIGPKVDSPEESIMGFLKSVSANSLDELEKITRPNGDYYSYNQKESAVKTIDILEKNLLGLLNKMASFWHKSMFWNTDSDSNATWIRPIRNILAIFDDQIVNFEFFGLKSNNLTFSPLSLGGSSFKISNFNDYQKRLEDNQVIIDQKIREKIIIDQINLISKNIGCSVIDNLEEKNHLFDEVVHLADFPSVLLGKIDQELMSLPPQILILTIKNHQKYFCLNDKDGNLVPYFLFVANIKITDENRQKIIADNEKVLRARLNDAKFFINEDLKINFSNRLENLKKITLHEKLGSIYEKVKRLQILNKFISIWIPHCDITEVSRLAELSKNDLNTRIIGELPELQGIIGRYYNTTQNGNKEISEALAEQYLPNNLQNDLPKTPLGILLSITDKIDTICGMFLIKEKPTGSRDPYALRRSALAIIRIINHHHLSLPLKIIIDKSINSFSLKIFKKIYPDAGNKELKLIKEAIAREIILFFIERLKFWLKENITYLIRQDVTNEVFNQLIEDNRNFDLYEIIRKSVFISKFVSRSENANLIELYKRASSIVTIEEKKDQKTYDDRPYFIGLKTKYDKLLYRRIKQIEPKIKRLLKNNDYEQCFDLLKELELPINQFFENVLVNCDERLVRVNRLLILGQIRNLFDSIFNLSKIEI